MLESFKYTVQVMTPFGGRYLNVVSTQWLLHRLLVPKVGSTEYERVQSSVKVVWGVQSTCFRSTGMRPKVVRRL